MICQSCNERSGRLSTLDRPGGDGWRTLALCEACRGRLRKDHAVEVRLLTGPGRGLARCGDCERLYSARVNADCPACSGRRLSDV